MRQIINVILFFLLNITLTSAQQDTVYYDSDSGNYILQYMHADTLVSLQFIPATKINPIINASVTTDTAGEDYFIYRYKVSNGENSVQNLNHFTLLFNVDSITSINTKGTWWNARMKEYKNGEFRFLNKWYWSGDNGLESGWQNDRFIISAKGLPGINKAYFQGSTPTFGFPGSIPDSKIVYQLAALSEFPTNYVKKETLSPRNIPRSFSGTVFIDTLIYYTAQSFELGWIADKETKTKYEDHFTKAKSALSKGDIYSARTYLENVIRDVDIDSASTLTSEAYALLRYNTEYLLKQLR